MKPAKRDKEDGCILQVRDSRISIVGLGYIGLPTAVMFANAGFTVRGVERDQSKIDAINTGTLQIDEPGLKEQFIKAYKAGCLLADTKAEEADVHIIAVPTPIDHERKLDFSFIRSAVESIAPILRSDDLVILESTVPPGTTARVERLVYDLRPDLSSIKSVEFAHCPERVLPGAIVREFKTNPRVVGGLTSSATTRAADFYRSVTSGRVFETSAETAELAKLAENAYRDVNIAFANELSAISDQFGVNVWELIQLANEHPRVNILRPGIGVGGHCIAVDPWFIVSADPEDAKLIKTARTVNDLQPVRTVQKLVDFIQEQKPRKVYLFGQSFKPNVGDTRESPAVEVSKRVSAEFPDIEFVLVDPHVSHLVGEQTMWSNCTLVNSVPNVSENDSVVCLVAHDAFRSELSQIRTSQKFIDLAGMFN
ncbi:nucleotide sugar dehydrogenase [Corynebacterium hesseae]|uniref:nucleotide sugar dehydrogenase n=1 Tax=Corynebacterium hesseae TaxID=2913502 RepID=UPI00373EF9AB